MSILELLADVVLWVFKLLIPSWLAYLLGYVMCESWITSAPSPFSRMCRSFISALIFVLAFWGLLIASTGQWHWLYLRDLAALSYFNTVIAEFWESIRTGG